MRAAGQRGLDSLEVAAQRVCKFGRAGLGGEERRRVHAVLSALQRALVGEAAGAPQGGSADGAEAVEE